jgi:hypothetical protein
LYGYTHIYAPEAGGREAKRVGDKFVIVEGLLFLTVPHPRRKKRIGDLLLWRETSSRTSANVFSLSLS